MISAIGNFSPYQAASGIFNTQKVTSPKEDLRELSSIASSYYSVSDTVQPLKTATESDSRWLYRAANNELGMPTGFEIDGLVETPAKITVNLNNGSGQMNPMQGAPQGVPPQGGAGATGGAGGTGGASSSEDSDDPMDLNGDGEVTIQEMREYYAQNANAIITEAIEATDLTATGILEDNSENNSENSDTNEEQNFLFKTAVNAYKQVNSNYINSYA